MRLEKKTTKNSITSVIKVVFKKISSLLKMLVINDMVMVGSLVFIFSLFVKLYNPV